LTSFENVEKLNNKGEENIKGLDIFQHMPLQQKLHGITSLPHSNMGRKNESNEISSYLHPSPLHPNVVLWKLHNLRDIQGARNHYLKLVEYEVNEHMTIPWERPVPMPIKLQPSMQVECCLQIVFTCFHTC
jgi:hypothetical protein